MQIRNQPVLPPDNPALTAQVSAAQRAQIAGAAFSKLIRSMGGAEKSDKTERETLVPSEEVQAAWSPQAIYQSMAMQVPSPTATSRTVRGFCWTDQTLAVFIGNGGELPIDTVKTIHWESEGNQELTPAQCEQLRRTYPLDGISAQEYYNLLSELTHLDVLSAEDCAGMHLASGALGISFSPENGQFDGNLLTHLRDTLAKMQQNWDWVHSEEYRQAELFDEETRAEYRKNLEQDLRARRRLTALLEQIFSSET